MVRLMNLPIYLFRRNNAFREEFEACSAVAPNRCFYRDSVTLKQLSLASHIVFRYCAHPFYRETHNILSEALPHAHMLNTWEDFENVTTMSYLRQIEGLTPQSYDGSMGYAKISDCPHGWVLRNTERSLKWKWNTHMRAPTRSDLPLIMSNLLDADMAVHPIIIREFVPLKTFEIGINGLPFENEWRCLFLRGKCIVSSYYWTVAENPPENEIPEEALHVAQEVIKRIDSECAGFYAVDVAEKEAGGWICIEVNMGEQSGIGMADPHVYYQKLDDSLRDS